MQSNSGWRTTCADVSTRSILRDETRYADPDTFNPLRFLTASGELDASVPDPVEMYGYGRRLCPGRYYADDLMFLATANILAAFVVEKPRDANGDILEPSGAFSDKFLKCGAIPGPRFCIWC